MLAGPEIAAEKMTRLLREFHNALTVHFANEDAETGSPSMAWWRELSSRCHEFSKQLMPA